jgi:prolyl-tRNA editing enzyme YbaK/EbsC (Cys-tRNA(Pro) deacylase)
LKPSEADEVLDALEEEAGNVKRAARQLDGKAADIFFHAPADTAEESAENTGFQASKIVKTLIFSFEDGHVAVLCPGDTSVSEPKLSDHLESDVELASPEQVTDTTGYIVGGVAPFDLDIPVLADERIMDHDEVKPSAGSRCAGVSLSPELLVEVTEAEAVDVSR